MDMKKLLLALDNPLSKPVKEIDDMKRFLSIVSESATVKSGSPVVQKTDSLLGKYISEAEQKTIDIKTKRQEAINKKAKRVAESVYMNGHDTEKQPDKTDTVRVDIPLLIRLLEYSREDAQSDVDLHNVAAQMVELSKSNKVLSMAQYEEIVGE